MPSIFISYRRTDAPGHAGRLYDRLVDRFGEANVFKDLDSMEPGADFVEVIEETVARCDALLAVIGRDWLESHKGGARRLDDPQDWVRLEIANALKRGIRVVPVLVHGATMPAAADLPEDVRPLLRRHAIELSESAWAAQVSDLLTSLERASSRPSSRAPSEGHVIGETSAGVPPERVAEPKRSRTSVVSQASRSGRRRVEELTGDEWDFAIEHEQGSSSGDASAGVTAEPSNARSVQGRPTGPPPAAPRRKKKRSGRRR